MKEEEEKEKEEKEQKEAISTLGEKILKYRNHLDTIPPKLISVGQSEQDRVEVNSSYPKFRTPSTQLLDSKFYAQLVGMNRERDKNFLREGTTRKERIRLLSKIMLRVTTPILFLNQRRVVELSNQTYFGIKSFDITQKKIKSENTFEEPVFEINVPIITQDDIDKIKSHLLTEYGNTEWDSLEQFNKQLNHWEADIFSQLARENEIVIKKNIHTGKIFLDAGLGSEKKGKSSSVILEPKF